MGSCRWPSPLRQAGAPPSRSGNSGAARPRRHPRPYPHSARIFLLRGGEVTDTFRAPIEVRKVGLERWLYRLALEEPFVYGIMSLAIAIAAGWGASVAFRQFRRS